MKCNVIGPGVVGQATGRGLTRFGHQITYTDKGERPAVEADIHLVCTPESEVPAVVLDLAQNKLATIVVRSSTPPGTIRRLAHEVDMAIWHNPEQLREATAEQDFLNTVYTLVGYAGPGDDDGYVQNCEELDALYAPMQVAPVYCMATESEMAKLATNAYLSAQISFWNQISWLCDGLDLNSHRVARLVALDPRVSQYGANMHGRPFGGHCLPKDLAALIELAHKLPSPVAAPLLEAVQKVNVSLGGGKC